MHSIERRYEPDTLILETVFHTADGIVALIDFMPLDGGPAIHREVLGIEGDVRMRMELVVRFDYGSITPWVKSTGDGLELVAGGEGLRFHSSVPVSGQDLTTVASFVAEPDERDHFSLTWFASHLPAPLPLDTSAALYRTRARWRQWTGTCTYEGGWVDEVMRSLITLKALSYSPTGAIAAAATTSLPEEIGGIRNWDYRFSWLRDATFTLRALLLAGFDKEAEAWADWLRRAVAGHPGEFQIMYGVHGERRLTEMEIPWLPGYAGSAPVRIGNAATQQFQLDVFGEVMDAAYTARQAGLHGVNGYSPGAVAGPVGAPGDRVGGAGRGDLGDPGTPAAVHPLEGHGVGGLRPWCAPGPETTRSPTRTRSMRWSSGGRPCAMPCTTRSATTDGTRTARRSPRCTDPTISMPACS